MRNTLHINRPVKLSRIVDRIEARGQGKQEGAGGVRNAGGPGSCKSGLFRAEFYAKAKGGQA